MKKHWKYNITLLWGTWEFGIWLTKYIYKNFPDNIERLIITWRNKEKWEKIAKEIGCIFSNDNIASSKDADIVVFWVSISQTEKTIKQVMPHLKKWSVAFDITSVKKWPSKWMKEYAQKWVTVIPTHPMFWPYISNIAGQVFVLTPEEEIKKYKEYIFLKDFLLSRWAKVIEETPKQHDKMMAVIQWLTHYSIFILWKTIKRIRFNIEKSMEFISPVYKIMFSITSRYIWQNPKLYADIQMYNDEILSIQKEFIQVSKDFNSAVLKKDKKKFTKYLENTKQYFWEKTAIEWQEYSDKIIYMIGNQVRKVQENIWKEMKFKNIYSSKILDWKIKSFDGEKIILEEWKKLDINKWEVL